MGRSCVRPVLVAIAIAFLLDLWTSATAAGAPGLRLEVALRGVVPANAAVSYQSGTSGTYLCLPATATAGWSHPLPPCRSGVTYVADTMPPLLGPNRFAFGVAFCGDPACSFTTGGETIWAATLPKGASGVYRATYWFGGVPDTDTGLRPGGSRQGDTGDWASPLLVAAVTGLAVAWRRDNRRHRPVTAGS